MARHVIPTAPPWQQPNPDFEFEGAGVLVWDDEAGTVEGGTAEAEDAWTTWVRELLARGAPLDLSGDGRILVLQDPAHDPRDFWHLLPSYCWKEPLRSRMPAILRDVEPTEWRPAPPPRIIVDGVERDAIEGVEFVW